MIFIEDLKLKNEYNYIMAELGNASMIAIPCEEKDYGVGYTNAIEALPYCIPIILTYNPNMHLNPEKEGIGYVVQPHDVKTWEHRIEFLKHHPKVCMEIVKKIETLISNEYNDKTTAQYIINDFKELLEPRVFKNVN